MAISFGNQTLYNGGADTPSYTTFTVSHTQDIGSDRLLVVTAQMANTSSFLSATYNGVALTGVALNSFDSQNWVTFILDDPPEGTYNIVFTFSGPQYNDISVFAQSFLGADGVGNTVVTSNYANSPRTESITVSDGSIVILSGFSSQTGTPLTMTIDGFGYPAIYQHNVNRQVYGTMNFIPLAAGSIDCTINLGPTWKGTTVQIVEILESATSGGSDGFMLMFNE